MIQICNFGFTYPNGKKAVSDLNLTIEPGDLFAFIGHNGAGKTTTIKAMVGILDFKEGDILIFDKSIKKEPLECKKELAFIPDNPDLYDSLTGNQYLNFVADIFNIDSVTRKELIEQYAKEFEIYDDLTSQIASYSHGMKQKLAIISALIHNPKILVLDEPFVGLDPKATYMVKQIMHRFCENGGIIFFSTHVLDVAEKLCNKIAIIKEGKLIKTGKMEEVVQDSSLEEVFLELTDNA